jgi:hypothetical protein
MLDQRHGALRSLGSRIRHSLGSRTVEPRVSNAVEPCASCGEETAAGSVLYSDRHVAIRSDGTSVVLCSFCNATLRGHRKSEPLTEEELNRLADNGLMIGAGFLGGGGQ